MIERPILFNGDMVRAILDGTKTQTRRIVKLNASGRTQCKGKNWHVEDPDAVLACPFGKAGDRLWVRETFIRDWKDENGDGEPDQYDEDGNENPIQTFYRADGHIDWEIDGEWCNTPWKPSIHMPRAASRITLEITNVRIDRLHRISESDSKKEGSECLITKNCTAKDRSFLNLPIMNDLHPYKNGFALQWDSIYGNWKSNPWVWAIEYRLLELKK